jgi:hypothetical protein
VVSRGALDAKGLAVRTCSRWRRSRGHRHAGRGNQRSQRCGFSRGALNLLRGAEFLLTEGRNLLGDDGA